MIDARRLTKRYGDKLAVDDLSFTVRPGVVTGFLGPNGAGKSTTMRMVMGMDGPTSGSVTVNGRPYHEIAWPLREIGALLEARAIHPGRSARTHLQMLADASRIPAAGSQRCWNWGARRRQPLAGRQVLTRHGAASHTAGAISAFVGVLLVLPIIVSALPTSVQNDITRFLPATMGRALMSGAHHEQHVFAPWTGFLLLVGYTAAVLAVAVVLLVRRYA